MLLTNSNRESGRSASGSPSVTIGAMRDELLEVGGNDHSRVHCMLAISSGLHGTGNQSFLWI